MKKINTFFLLFLVSTLSIFSQEDEKTNQKLLNDASFIFKGTVISETPFKGEHEKDFLVSYEIKIETIYKNKNNKLNIGNITLISKSVMGWSESNGYIIPDIVSEYTPEEQNKFNLGTGVSGVFVCNPYTNNSVKIPATKNKISNTVVLEPICDTKNCLFLYVDAAKYVDKKIVEYEYISGFGKYFVRYGKTVNGKNIWQEETTVWEKLDSYLKELGITPQKESVKKKDATFLEEKKQNEILYNQRVKNYNERKAILEQRYQNSVLNKNGTTSKAIEDIDFEIANEQVTGASPQFYEFDILVSGSSSNTYIDNTAFVIEYNTIPFGSNIVANNKVTITRGTNYNTATYEDPMSGMTDDAVNAIRFHVGTDYNAGSWNRPLLTPAQQQLAHIKIEIQNCTGTTDLQFIDIVNVSFVDLYTLSPTIDPLIAPFTQYNNAYYNQPFNNFALCPPPIITNMFPNPISSGTGSVLTIQGSGFGNTRGSGQIWMLDDKGGSSIIKNFDYIDYVSWSDTEIKFIVPSNIDTLGMDTLGLSVGSGDVAVKRNDGITGSSAGFTPPLDIHYANTNVSIGKATPSYKKIPVRLVDINPNDLDTGMVFYLDTSITNNPAMEIAVKQAIHDWSCATLINWKVKNDTILQNGSDGISVIYLDDNFHGDPLAKTRGTNGSACTDNQNNLIVYYADYDIGFSRDFNNIAATQWFVDTNTTQNLPPSEQDFYAVAQHELGHAHGLDHVNDITDIMYYGNIPGPVSAANRFHLFGSPDAITGGDYVVTKSAFATTCGGVGAMIPSSAQNCTAIIGISELFNKNIELVAYPNPADELLNLSFKLKRNADIRISLFDYMGKEVKSINKGKQNIGTQTMQMNVADVAAGFYFLRMQVDNKAETVKLIIK
ncbi:MAG: T9SS type A sorting domain-containing protein [Flavobacteriales bacterium]|nr:T9SS type A sorting domain-containing protein [Flavobacteriales bacterium]